MIFLDEGIELKLIVRQRKEEEQIKMQRKAPLKEDFLRKKVVLHLSDLYATLDMADVWHSIESMINPFSKY